MQEIRALTHEIEKCFDHAAMAHGVERLSGPQGHVVLYLMAHDEDEISIKTIEKELKISKSVASNLVKRMEKNGFITIKISPKDKRIKLLYLTDFGRRKAHDFETFLKTTHREMFKGITDEELETAIHVSKTIAKNVQEKNKEFIHV